MAKVRVPMQVSPAFEKKIKDLQTEIMKRSGIKPSLRDLTEQVDFKKLDDMLLKDAKVDIKIALDRRIA